MRRALLTILIALSAGAALRAQRPMDKLDRGVVAVPSGSGYLVSWRIMGEEYYDTQYNLYRDGTLIGRNLSVSNYLDTGGKATSKYTVAPVVRGTEQAQSATATPWTSGYYEFAVDSVYARGGSNVTVSHSYTINDIALGDVDGDGVAEFIVKRLNGLDITDMNNDSCFNLIECYTLAGKRLWWIDCGPNLMSGSGVETNMVSYDWDEDGKAEFLMRGADNMVIHKADGTTQEVGDMSLDTRFSGMKYTTTGAEYLLYLNGETGEPYQIIDYPLPRYDEGEAEDEGSIWGAGIAGHRPTKHFFGAPFLDGRHASIFLARGIYTREKMVALDVDPATHQLSERWRWKCYDSSSKWYGNGYHNFAIADVDMDGCDEIVYGSMVIDDSGKGLSTTGLGHGDAQHCGDFDPYRWGLEQFACNETSPAMNYRNATTSEFYYRHVGTSDDGRALCGNFTNDYPGCVGRSTQTGMISTVADKVISELGDLVAWNNLNFRIYWDDDLCEEVVNSPGTERECIVIKPGGGRIFQSSGCKMINWSKNNPCAQADLFGDWREELVLRNGDDTAIRIYATPYETSYRNYTLWHDMQYRQAMVWQMLGYNQPPHVSYFLGELEGITVAPPPVTMTGRTEVADGGTISASYDDQHIIVCERGNTSVAVADGAKPYIATFNVPSHVEGNDDNNDITYTYYTCNVTGGAFAGQMRLVKQGEGTLVLPSVTQNYTGDTDVWGGTLQFGGTLLKSRLWLNRFATLSSDGGQFRSIHADYAATIQPGGKDNIGSLTTDTLALGFGARLLLDIDGATQTADHVDVNTVLSVEKKDWDYGPKYSRPIVEFHIVSDADTLQPGQYDLGTVKSVDGSVSDLIIGGLSTKQSAKLSYEDGHLYLTIGSLRAAASIIWNGDTSDVWDFASTPNWTLAADTTMRDEVFVSGDVALFNDDAAQFDVQLGMSLSPDSVIVDNTTAYTFSGEGSIDNDAVLVKRGTGTLTIQNANSYTGGTRLSGGVTKVSSLSNSTQATGNLGGVTQAYTKFIMENGATLQTTAEVTMGSPMQMVSDKGGIISNSSAFNMNKAITGTLLTKKGSGWLNLYAANSSLEKLVIVAGTVQPVNNVMPAKTVEFQGGTLSETGGGSSYTINVPAKKTGTWNLTGIATYSNKLTGEGTLTVYMPSHPNYEGVTRTPVTGNWSAFAGTLKLTTYSTNVPFTFNNSYGLPNATVDIQDGRTVCNTQSKTFRIGKLTGSGSLGGVVVFSQTTASGICTWQVGNDESWQWDGKVTGSCALTKMGTGKMSVTNKEYDFTGAMRVQEGEFHFSSGVTLGTGALTVVKGATLSGTTSSSAPLTNSAYTINGTLQVGISATSATGEIDFGDKNVTFANTSVLRLGVRKCATSTFTGGASLQGIKKLTMNGTVSVFVTDNHTLQVGDSVILWQATTTAGTPTLESQVIDETAGLYWDDSRLSEGILLVTDQVPTAISSVSTAQAADIQVINASGVAVARYKATPEQAIEQLKASELPDGVYLLRIPAEGGIRTLKVRK